MTYYSSTMAPQFRQRLTSRAEELQRVFQDQVAAAGFPAPHQEMQTLLSIVLVLFAR